MSGGTIGLLRSGGTIAGFGVRRYDTAFGVRRYDGHLVSGGTTDCRTSPGVRRYDRLSYLPTLPGHLVSGGTTPHRTSRHQIPGKSCRTSRHQICRTSRHQNRFFVFFAAESRYWLFFRSVPPGRARARLWEGGEARRASSPPRAEARASRERNCLYALPFVICFLFSSRSTCHGRSGVPPDTIRRTSRHEIPHRTS